MNKIKYQFRTFLFAFRGIAAFFHLESKAVIHLTAAVLALGAGWFLEISTIEWLFVVFAIVLVFMAELFNTIAEEMADIVQPDHDQRIGRIKDMAAGAVLIAAVGALTIGLIIFLPKLVDLISQG